jgi:exodeoxyribonuclease VII large subunit
LRRTEGTAQQLDFLQRRLIHPSQRLQQQALNLDQLQQRLRMACPDLGMLGLRQKELLHRLQAAMRRMLEAHSLGVRNLQQHLLHLDPQEVLKRGYSLVRDERGALVTDSDSVPLGARLDITFAHGWGIAELKDKGSAR